MKRIILLIAVTVLLIGCGRKRIYHTYYKDIDTGTVVLEINETDSVIEATCEEFEKDSLSSEDIAYWDSLNATGAHLIVRNAERDLDTIVNHVHIVFTTQP